MIAPDAIDLELIRLTQAGLPLTPQPYRDLATQLGLSAEDVMVRLERMLAGGLIRRIGAVPNHYALGYTANGMTVWDVADDQVDALGEAVGRLACVSHCYRRPRALPDWPYNLFAMVHGHDQGEVMRYATEIGLLLGSACRRCDILYSTRILKKTGLRLASQTETPPATTLTRAAAHPSLQCPTVPLPSPLVGEGLGERGR